MKECTICKNLKSFDEFYFYKKNSVKKGEYIYYYPYCKECSAKKSVKWYTENPEKFKEFKRKQNAKLKNKLIVNERNKEFSKNGYFLNWQRNNKDKVKRYRLFREQHKTHMISQEEWESCKDYFDNSCAYCGMTEAEHSIEYSQDLHKDHVDHNGANDLSNCVPACKSCNSSKHTTKLEKWYNNENPKYSKERLESIHVWLNIVKN